MNETPRSDTENKGYLQRLRGSGNVWRLSVVTFFVVTLPTLVLFELEARVRYGNWNLLKERPTFLVSFLAVSFVGGLFVVLVARGIEWLGASRRFTSNVACFVAIVLVAYPLLMPVFYMLPFCVLWCIFSTVMMTYRVIPSKHAVA